METLNINKLKRNPDSIIKSLKIVGDATIATKNLKVYFPARFAKVGLAVLGTTSSVIGLYCIVDENNNYAVNRISAFQSFRPNNTNTVLVGKEEYIEFEILKDEPLILSNYVVQDASIIFNIFNELLLGGRVPFYYNYEDISKILTNTSNYNGSGIGNDPLAFEIIASIISRSPNNENIYYKDIIKKKDEVYNIRPSFVGMSDIFSSLDDTFSKIIGGYMRQGLVNAIMDPEKRSSDISKILRS